MQAKRDNSGKIPLSFILEAPMAVNAVCRVMKFGAEKYGHNDWRKGFDEKEGLDSVLRHIQSHLNGHLKDSDTGERHLAHAVSGLLMYLDNDIRGVNYNSWEKEGGSESPLNTHGQQQLPPSG